MSSVSETRQRLAQKDPTYQRLFRKHQEYELRLSGLRDRRHLTGSEQVEEVKLKKLKLALKDHLEQLVRRAAD